ncbi:MAG: glycoside hydrolase family 26 protein [Muribaculaceae bacterium]|nr:glycoside hydrolase family 26 protein [Muribaculaceae bacterium]
MRFFHSLTACLLSLSISACDTAAEPSNDDNDISQATVALTLSDKQATAETKALYSNLWSIAQKGFMFGHHDDLMYGRYWYNEPGRSDTKDVCGDYPAVYSLDFAELSDNRADGNESTEIRRRCILEARERGMVITACAHWNNPLTGGDSWDNSSDRTVAEILTEGSEANRTFTAWLDRLADFLLNLRDSQGRLVPIIFRPFHEHTQSWSWWGSSCTSEQQFISLWQFTVKYLRDTKGVHQLIYAISPQMDSQKNKEDFLYRWPGDDYVDFIGMDCYHGLSPTVFAANIKELCLLSKEKLKPCGVTETGVEGFTAADYWTKQILTPATGRTLSFIVTWRNKFVGGNDSDNHYYSVWKGHPSEKDFIKFHKSSSTYFCSDLPDMYTMAEGVSVE